MEWTLRYGTEEFKKLFKVMRDDGRVHPAELTKKALRREDKRYYDAFSVLSASREWSQVGPMPIRISEVESLMNMIGISDPDTRCKYLRLIQGMDGIERRVIQANMAKK